MLQVGQPEIQAVIKWRLSLILRSNNAVDMRKFADVEIFEQEIKTKKGQHFKVAILHGGFTQEYPQEYMDNVVSEYTKDYLHNQFVESHLDMPWVRVILTGINELDYVPFDNHHLNGDQ